jgi:8-oxo-dGTP pyrophosphatase MutT (NUDIX family)
MSILRGRGEGRITPSPARLLSEVEISARLAQAYQPGAISATDGYARMPGDLSLKCAAVLIPFAWFNDEWQLVFTRRTDTVEHHKGQVSFPGGACDDDESMPEATALREAKEEIGLDPADVHILGRLNAVVTITGYRVTPVVGVMPWPYPVRPAPEEVKRVFSIPLQWLAEQDNWEEHPFTPDGMSRSFPVVIYREYDGEVLWGASARMMLNLLSVLEI